MSTHRAVPVVDLFAGPGGLGEGFSALRTHGGRECFDVKLSIEKDPWAHKTLELRAFVRQFPPNQLPGKYYDLLRGATDADSVYAKFPEQAANAEAEAWHAELGVEARGTSAAGSKQRSQLRRNGCSSAGRVSGYSVVGRSRNKGIDGTGPIGTSDNTCTPNT